MPAKRPLIGCTTYRKTINQDRPIEMYGLMTSYVDAIRAAGGVPLLIPLGASDEDLQAIFERLDGVLLPGGGDIAPERYNGRPDVTMWGIDPQRDQTEITLVRLAVRQEKPFMAICRGIQVMNVALGGTLVEDIPSQIETDLEHDTPSSLPRTLLRHTVAIQADSLLARHLGKIESPVNSLHHQSVRDLAPELRITAEAPDGVVEAAEVPGHPFALGVQWHPENLIHDDPAMLALFKGFVAAAAG
jgi:putative glutamine amidotransferase